MSERYYPLLISKIDEGWAKRNLWSWIQLWVILATGAISIVNIWVENRLLWAVWAAGFLFWGYAFGRFLVWVRRTRRLVAQQQARLDEHNEYINKRFFN